VAQKLSISRDTNPVAVARVRKKRHTARRAIIKLSRSRKPDELSLEAWQTGLRRQFGREQRFALKNIGREPFFSEFEVTNPDSNHTYRVAIRGTQPGGPRQVDVTVPTITTTPDSSGSTDTGSNDTGSTTKRRDGGSGDGRTPAPTCRPGSITAPRGCVVPGPA